MADRLAWGITKHPFRKFPQQTICYARFTVSHLEKISTAFMATTDTAEIKGLQLHDKDTGSADVQVALLTRRINELTEHLKISRPRITTPAAASSRWFPAAAVLLDYLNDTDNDRYKKVHRSSSTCASRFGRVRLKQGNPHYNAGLANPAF